MAGPIPAATPTRMRHRQGRDPDLERRRGLEAGHEARQGLGAADADDEPADAAGERGDRGLEQVPDEDLAPPGADRLDQPDLGRALVAPRST